MLQRLLLLFSMMFSQLHNPIRPPAPTIPVPIMPEQQQSLRKDIAHCYRTLRKKSIFKDNKKILRYACTHFKDVPGFSRVLAHLTRGHNDANSLGHLYEIEAAVELHQDNYAILAFNQMKHSPDDNRCCEIDLEVEKDGKPAWVECKNSCWNNPSTIKKQLRRQRIILSAFNKSHDSDIEHILCSRKKIPNSLKKWFIEHQIQPDDQH